MKYLTINCFALLLLLTACRSDYEKVLSEERAKGERRDSIWLGFHFGMPQKTFYDTCWAMNQRGVLSHGTQLPTTTRLNLSADFSSPAYVNFFPEFEDGKILSFYAVFVFDDWSPWNKETSQQKLLESSARWLEKTLPGNKFIEINHAEKGKLLVKVDGNREILLYPFKEQKVKATILDLNNKKK